MAWHDDNWRRQGTQWRQRLLDKDKREGGTKFHIHSKLPVSSYFDVAERVLSQFRAKYESRSDIEELYIMGHRLVTFLSKVLPNHPDYRHSDASNQRAKSQMDLCWIKQRLDIVALRIDEQQLNRFILDDLRTSENANKFQQQLQHVPSLEVSFDSYCDFDCYADDAQYYECNPRFSDDLAEVAFRKKWGILEDTQETNVFLASSLLQATPSNEFQDSNTTARVKKESILEEEHSNQNSPAPCKVRFNDQQNLFQIYVPSELFDKEEDNASFIHSQCQSL